MKTSLKAEKITILPDRQSQLRYLEQEMGKSIPNLRVAKVAWKDALLATPRPLK